jgi:putative spermidine/putrescine transport system permease protein
MKVFSSILFLREFPLIGLSALFLAFCFGGPFLLLLAASFGEAVAGGDWKFGLSLGNYIRLWDPYFGRSLVYTLSLALSVATICVVVAVPFTWTLVQCSGRTRSIWMIFLLAGLTLSEVLVAFAWHVLLSSSSGLPKLFVAIGWWENATALQPGIGAIVVALVYLAFPFAVILLHAPFASIDASLAQASRTLGAGPFRTFFSVVLPLVYGPLVAVFLLVFILSASSFVTPQVLGLPQHWTLPVLIAEQALYRFNLPFASALAMLLLAGSLLILRFSEQLRKLREEVKKC